MSIKTRNTVIVFFLIILMIGAGIAFYQTQRQQELRGRASTFHWSSANSAMAVCSSAGTIFINVRFTNQEASRSMVVTATDSQSSQSADLGVVAPGKTNTASIDTKLTQIKDGRIIFSLAWADNPEQKDTASAPYKAIDSCPEQLSYCSEITTSACLWDELAGATKYNITITDATDGSIVSTQTVDAPSTKLEFQSQTGKTYQCSVSAVNECGAGAESKSIPVMCTQQITPTPTVPVCVENESTCSWDSLPEAGSYNVTVVNTDTGEVVKSGNVEAPATDFKFPSESGVSYQCKVSAVNECGVGEKGESSPTVCNIPTPTITPIPSITLPPTNIPRPSTTGIPPTPSTLIPSRPLPTNTPNPSYTPAPTLTPAPTNTPYPTATPRPTNTPYPTATPYPTVTPRPTNTPAPTYTPIPTPTTVKMQPNQKPGPTIAATGTLETTAVIAGVSLILAIIGGIIFFAL